MFFIRTTQTLISLRKRAGWSMSSWAHMPEGVLSDVAGYMKNFFSKQRVTNNAAILPLPSV